MFRLDAPQTLVQGFRSYVDTFRRYAGTWCAVVGYRLELATGHPATCPLHRMAGWEGFRYVGPPLGPHLGGFPPFPR
jgi:hypothetical protein